MENAMSKVHKCISACYGKMTMVLQELLINLIEVDENLLK